ncbi:MAG: LysM peptidoglycan-binding domain-containing protein, partial [Deltaproteobacteria bacterium]|nr:LysM peptidoglycan-binding domain-containing protein [Deltaproteobacteria bacterium]
YRVRRGDSPDKIARKHKMGLERFLQINDLTRRSKIMVNRLNNPFQNFFFIACPPL